MELELPQFYAGVSALGAVKLCRRDWCKHHQTNQPPLGLKHTATNSKATGKCRSVRYQSRVFGVYFSKAGERRFCDPLDTKETEGRLRREKGQSTQLGSQYSVIRAVKWLLKHSGAIITLKEKGKYAVGSITREKVTAMSETPRFIFKCKSLTSRICAF